ncbi:MAG: porin [Balneolaceae bacterium]
MNSCRNLIPLAALLLLFFGTDLQLHAQSSGDEPVVVTPNRNTVSELRVRGRIQNQYAFATGSNSNAAMDAEDYSSFEMRRIRLGVQGKLYNDWDFLVEMNTLASVGLDAATLTYTGFSGANITIGKAKTFFGSEQMVSSASILTFERTRLDAHMNGGKPIGLRVHDSRDLFTYYLGVYNGQNTGTGRMGADSDSYILNASGGVKLGNFIGDGVQADLRADYMHSTDAGGYYQFENAYAFSGHFEVSGVDLRTEFMSGNRFNEDNLSGFYVLPAYYIVPGSLQAVARYEQVSGDAGVSIGHNRYADRVPNLYSAGNDYSAIYAGLNYYVEGHNLKFMLGAELAENSGGTANQSGKVTTIFAGMRMQF